MSLFLPSNKTSEDKTATEETPAPETPEPQEEVVTPEPAVTEEKTVPGGMVTSVVQDEEEEEEEEERPVKKSKRKFSTRSVDQLDWNQLSETNSCIAYNTSVDTSAHVNNQ